MKRLPSARRAMAVCAVLIPMTAFAQAPDSDGCTNETLKGDYAFRITDSILNDAGTPVQNRDGVAMTHFDGKGRLTQVDFVMVNGLPQTAPRSGNGLSY